MRGCSEMKKCVSLNKKIVSLSLALLLSLISVTCFSASNIIANSTVSRTYYRHNCSSSDPASYDTYTISFSSNGIPTTYNVPSVNDLVDDDNLSVVSIGMYGTGFIVDNHVIATAAHCVYSNGEFLNPTIYITENTISNYIEVDYFTPNYIHIYEEYVRYGYSDYDYALIYVEEDLSEYGIWNLGFTMNKFMEDENQVYATGYSQENPNNYGYGRRYTSEGTLYPNPNGDFNERVITHRAFIAGGMSGGPVWISENITLGGQTYNYKSVIGITTSIYPNGHSVAVRMNYEIAYFLCINQHLTEEMEDSL